MSMSLVRVEVHSMTWGAFSLKSIEWRPVLLAPGLVAGVKKLVDVDSPSPNAPCADAMFEIKGMMDGMWKQRGRCKRELRRDTATDDGTC